MTSENRTRVAVAVCLCLAILSVSAPIEAKKKKEVLTITGEIKAAEMRGQKVLTVYLNDAEHGEFIVLRGTDVNRKLVKQVGTTIRAKGYVGIAHREKAFDRFIDILEYEVVEKVAVND